MLSSFDEMNNQGNVLRGYRHHRSSLKNEYMYHSVGQTSSLSLVNVNNPNMCFRFVCDLSVFPLHNDPITTAN